MTRADKSPVKRIVRGSGTREYVVEVRGDLCLLRPLRSRQGGASEIAVSWDGLYARCYQPRRKRKPRRGVLKA